MGIHLYLFHCQNWSTTPHSIFIPQFNQAHTQYDNRMSDMTGHLALPSLDLSEASTYSRMSVWLRLCLMALSSAAQCNMTWGYQNSEWNITLSSLWCAYFYTTSHSTRLVYVEYPKTVILLTGFQVSPLCPLPWGSNDCSLFPIMVVDCPLSVT